MTYRLLAVHAHPDDESSKGAATYAAYVARGARVCVVSNTGGEAGDVLNSTLERHDYAARDLPGLRRHEMATARDLLGIDHRWLGYIDSGMPSDDGSVPFDSFAHVPIEVSVRPLIRLIREFRPHVIVTYDERGGYPHPDHIRTHEITMRAWELAGTTEFPELGAPWEPLKLYYDRILNGAKAERIAEVLRENPDEVSPEVLEQLEAMIEWMKDKPQTITTRVEVGEWFGVRDEALRAHASQVAPDHPFFFAVPRDLERRVWPTEDFELVKSRVPASTPETDLFAGIDDDGEEPGGSFARARQGESA